MKHSVHFIVNDQPYDLDFEAGRLLIDALRYDIGLTGTKEGCGIGVCGACTILINGKPASACLMLAVQADGAEITTIEGLGHNGQLDPLQQSFIDHGGFQCGICTPGHIVAARALLNEIPHPTTDQIKEWMMGNLCRCTGYYKIIESIHAAAGQMP